MGRTWGRVALATLLLTGAAAACSDDGGSGDEAAAAPEATTHPEATPAPDDLVAEIEDAAGPDGACDPLDARQCLLPFPSNRWTRPAQDTRTGLRVHLPRRGMPSNVDGTAISPNEWNRNDGFSPGTPLITFVPGLDPEQSGLNDITDVPASLEEDSPVVVIDALTGERHPVWAELDANADDDADRVLFIRPGTSWLEGHRYVVALRGLVDSSGEDLEPSAAFQAYRDNLTTDLPTVEDHRP